MSFKVGETVGPYRITEELGQGGMATVYKGYHASLDRYVAIKVLHPMFKDDESFFTRFQREAQIVANLEHPHIVPVHDFATAGEKSYIVMKFIEGQTLKHRMKSNPLSLDETLRIMPAIASALTYAHNKGILHRDIKPSNVMIEHDGTPYLTDFGLARITTRGESTMSQDVLLGTPNYISPEQARAEKNLGPGTDIYSLGIILYEIVVGRVPFSADTPYAVVHDHIYKPLPIPSLVNPTVPKEIEQVLLKALSKTPEDRFQSAVAMIDAFRVAVRDSNLNELSATSIRLENFNLAADDTAGTPSKAEIDNYIKATIARELQAASEHTPAVPPIISSTTPPPYYPATPYPQQIRPHRMGRGFWVLSGIAALFCICIASLAVTINAFQNPIVQSNPALSLPDDEIATEALDAAEENVQINVNISVADAEAWVAEEPENPAAYFSLGMLQVEKGDSETGTQNIFHAIEDLQAPATLIAEAAYLTAGKGFDDEAVLLYFSAYYREPENAAIRNAAGDYIYRQFDDTTLADIGDLQSQLDSFPETAFTKTMAAHALLSSMRLTRNEARLELVHRRLDEALALDDSFAEAQLVYGNYYRIIGETENAIQAWRFAGSFADSPQWVQRESSRLLQTVTGVEGQDTIAPPQ
ncbi:MAG TPA: protein kinase [Aggregatilineales bacterium]|nr:protein kinase [Aggregatilineales bacterium]